jgi:hypothetical protein
VRDGENRSAYEHHYGVAVRSRQPHFDWWFTLNGEDESPVDDETIGDDLSSGSQSIFAIIGCEFREDAPWRRKLGVRKTPPVKRTERSTSESGSIIPAAPQIRTNSQLTRLRGLRTGTSLRSIPPYMDDANRSLSSPAMAGQVYSESRKLCVVSTKLQWMSRLSLTRSRMAQSEHKASAPDREKHRRHVLHTPSRIWAIDQVVRPGDHSRQARQAP